MPLQWRVHCSQVTWRDVHGSNTPWQGVFLELSSPVFFFVFFCIFQGGISQRQVSAMEQTRDKVGTIFFSRSTPRAFLVRPALGSCSPQKHKKKKPICLTRYLRERRSPLFFDQSERTSNSCQAVSQWWRYKQKTSAHHADNNFYSKSLGNVTIAGDWNKILQAYYK